MYCWVFLIPIIYCILLLVYTSLVLGTNHEPRPQHPSTRARRFIDVKCLGILPEASFIIYDAGDPLALPMCSYQPLIIVVPHNIFDSINESCKPGVFMLSDQYRKLKIP